VSQPQTRLEALIGFVRDFEPSFGRPTVYEIGRALDMRHDEIERSIYLTPLLRLRTGAYLPDGKWYEFTGRSEWQGEYLGERHGE